MLRYLRDVPVKRKTPILTLGCVARHPPRHISVTNITKQNGAFRFWRNSARTVRFVRLFAEDHGAGALSPALTFGGETLCYQSYWGVSVALSEGCVRARV